LAGRYLVHTFGCQMNAHDSDRMEEVLRANGWTCVEGDNARDEVDLIVLNTCSVREKAEQKLRSEVGKLAPLKEKNPGLVIAVAGCVAQQEGEKLLARVPHLDLVIGPDNIPELPALALEQMAGAPPRARTVFDLDAPRFLAATPRAGEAPVSVYVTTMKGCDERCSFCIVPYTRGPERYRPSEEITREIASWVEAGAREVTLLGQTVDSFRDRRCRRPRATTPTRASSLPSSASSPSASPGSCGCATRAPTRATSRRRSCALTPSSTSSRSTSTCRSSPAATGC
jgi:tRNA-2-methylthio-N6-dimethylallyladenosine synthase